VAVPEIGIYEAKTHLASLLARVERGETFVITRHGKPVARLSAVVGHDEDAVRRLLARVRKGREALGRRGVYWADLLGEGESLRDLAHRGHRF
jgi:prevent-host-death family protein